MNLNDKTTHKSKKTSWVDEKELTRFTLTGIEFEIYTVVVAICRGKYIDHSFHYS